jgi:hypothetical protein
MQDVERTEVFNGFTIRVWKTHDGRYKGEITRTDGGEIKTEGNTEFFLSIPINESLTVEGVIEEAKRLIKAGGIHKVREDE